MSVKIYEEVEGLDIEIPIYDVEDEEVPIAIISSQKFYVLRPNSLEEEEWAVELVSPNILKHKIPEGANILPGKYKIQPYIETVDGYKGRCETVEIRVFAKMK